MCVGGAAGERTKSIFHGTNLKWTLHFCLCELRLDITSTHHQAGFCVKCLPLLLGMGIKGSCAGEGGECHPHLNHRDQAGTGCKREKRNTDPLGPLLGCPANTLPHTEKVSTS